jgi:hypothetical protein
MEEYLWSLFFLHWGVSPSPLAVSAETRATTVRCLMPTARWKHLCESSGSKKKKKSAGQQKVRRRLCGRSSCKKGMCVITELTPRSTYQLKVSSRDPERCSACQIHCVARTAAGRDRRQGGAHERKRERETEGGHGKHPRGHSPTSF